MRLLSLVAAGFTAWVSGQAAQPAPASLLTWHFAGVQRLAGDTNGSLLRAVLAQPTTTALLQQAKEAFAQSPRNLFPAVAATVTNRALLPLLEDMIPAESLGDIRAGDWAVAVKLSPELVARWQGAWQPLMVSLGASIAKQGDVQEARWANPVGSARLGQVGEWTVVGGGDGSQAAYQAVAARAKATRPGGPASGWLELGVDLTQLAPRLGWSSAVVWPRVTATVAGRARNLRTQARLEYPEPLALKLDAWRIPTNSVREPVVSFSALRGMGTWLARQPWYGSLGVSAAPNQIFGWSQSQLPFQMYSAWAWPEPTNTLPRVQAQVAAVFTNSFPEVQLGPVTNVTYDTALHRLQWSGLPLLVPFIEASTEDPGFAVAGIFPVHPVKPRAPAPLFSEILVRTNLVYYDWELTDNRLASWEAVTAFRDMLALRLPPPTNNLAAAWTQDTNVTRNLGNCVTEIVIDSPRTLSFTRTSAVGLTGLELVRLVPWLADPAFPRRSPPRLSRVAQRQLKGPVPSAPALPGPARVSTPK